MDNNLITKSNFAIGKALDDYIRENQDHSKNMQDEKRNQKLLITMATTPDETNQQNQESLIPDGIMLCKKCNNYTYVN